MTRNTATRRLAWCYLPVATSPIGGGLFKIGGVSTWVAVSVGLAPYVIWAALCVIFLIGYALAVIRYLCSGHDGQDAMTGLITTSTNAVVSILTLTPIDCTRRELGEGKRQVMAESQFRKREARLHPVTNPTNLVVGEENDGK
jgi:hypothetical protein